jgi:hypothetical protein
MILECSRFTIAFASGSCGEDDQASASGLAPRTSGVRHMMEDELVALAVYAGAAAIALTIYVRRTIRPFAVDPRQALRPLRRLALMARKLLLNLTVLASLGALPAQAANLDVTIAGVHSDASEILIGLYDREDGFKSAIDSSATKSAPLPQIWRIAGAALRAKAGSQSIIFTQLPPG